MQTPEAPPAPTAAQPAEVKASSDQDVNCPHTADPFSRGPQHLASRKEVHHVSKGDSDPACVDEGLVIEWDEAA